MNKEKIANINLRTMIFIDFFIEKVFPFILGVLVTLIITYIPFIMGMALTVVLIISVILLYSQWNKLIEDYDELLLEKLGERILRK